MYWVRSIAQDNIETYGGNVRLGKSRESFPSQLVDCTYIVHTQDDEMLRVGNVVKIVHYAGITPVTHSETLNHTE